MVVAEVLAEMGPPVEAAVVERALVVDPAEDEAKIEEDCEDVEVVTLLLGVGVVEGMVQSCQPLGTGTGETLQDMSTSASRYSGWPP